MGFTSFEKALRARSFMLNWAKTEIERQGGLSEIIKKIPTLCTRTKAINQRGVEAIQPPHYNGRERARLKRYFQENEM